MESKDKTKVLYIEDDEVIARRKGNLLALGNGALELFFSLRGSCFPSGN